MILFPSFSIQFSDVIALFPKNAPKFENPSFRSSFISTQILPFFRWTFLKIPSIFFASVCFLRSKSGFFVVFLKVLRFLGFLFRSVYPGSNQFHYSKPSTLNQTLPPLLLLFCPDSEKKYCSPFRLNSNSVNNIQVLLIVFSSLSLAIKFPFVAFPHFFSISHWCWAKTDFDSKDPHWFRVIYYIC